MMSANSRFWFLFGGIWLAVGVAFLAASLGVNLFADPETLNADTPLWVFGLVGFAAAAAGAAIIYFARAAAARDKRIIQTGIDLVATVIDLRRSAIDINRQARWHVRYRYEYSAGRVLEGESRALTGDDVQGYRPGDRVRIKVDPSKPEDSLFVGPA